VLDRARRNPLGLTLALCAGRLPRTVAAEVWWNRKRFANGGLVHKESMSPSTHDEDVTESSAVATDEDATAVDPVAAAAPTELLAATHHVPPGGMDWWSEPDPESAPDGRLDALVPLEVLEETVGWARVRASNGWEAWVDASQLVAGPAPDPTRRATRVSIALSIAGAAIAIIGSFLPWFTTGGADVSAWDIRVVALFTKEPTDLAVDAGPIILLTALVLVMLVLRRPLPAWAALALAAVPLVVGIAGLSFFRDLPGSGADLGIGVIVTLAGGFVMLAGAALSPRMLPRPLIRLA
jgi:hypothetical protein